MPAVNMPEEALPALQVLAELDDNVWESLRLFLNDEKIYKYGELIEKAENAVPTLRGDKIRMLLTLGFSIKDFLEEEKASEELVIDAVWGSACETKALAKLSDEQRDKVPARLHALVSGPAVSIICKVRSVANDNDFSFQKSRILTELRPVFGASAKDKPVTFALTHSLKLVYLKNGERKEMFVAMDDDDIESIHEQLVRAKEKALTLRKMMSDLGESVL